MVHRKDNAVYGPVALECKALATGAWRIKRPVINDKCVSCKTCISYCPCMCIDVKDGKTVEIDYTYCKGCGVCSTVCKLSAIEMMFEKEAE
ncbi:4Fe-4S binding protein [Ruminococcus flavefaciens]|uniref:4Fe-4S binding protein n=1 Tax=Ruminococcus flavefaciens TaxID=1265 RepID=UPI000467868B|nr:4Fe-4S binding protein [Ruminococcus flavefaciens]